MQTASMHLFQLTGFCSLLLSVADTLILNPTNQPTCWKNFKYSYTCPLGQQTHIKQKTALNFDMWKLFPPQPSFSVIFSLNRPTVPIQCCSWALAPKHFFLTHLSFLFIFFVILPIGSGVTFQSPLTHFTPPWWIRGRGHKCCTPYQGWCHTWVT